MFTTVSASHAQKHHSLPLEPWPPWGPSWGCSQQPAASRGPRDAAMPGVAGARPFPVELL